MGQMPPQIRPGVIRIVFVCSFFLSFNQLTCACAVLMYFLGLQLQLFTQAHALEKCVLGLFPGKAYVDDFWTLWNLSVFPHGTGD